MTRWTIDHHARRLSRALLALATASLVVAVAPAGSPVLSHSPDPVMGGALWRPDQPVRYRWRAGQVPPDWMRPAIHAAAGDSNASRASRAASFGYDADDGTGVISYGEPSGCGIHGLACFDRSGAPESFTVSFRRQGHVFDWGVLRWCQAYDDPPNGCYDVENVALDELGHVLVLAHHANYADGSDYLDAVVQTYSRTKPNVGWDAHDYGRCDVATLQLRYDMRSWAAPYSTCLDLATSLTLTVSDTTVAYGGLATFRASLRIPDLDPYYRLGGNPVSDRKVLLQRRPIGGATWSTVVTMTSEATPGSYVSSLSLTTGGEFRSVFPAPAGEGLAADTSGTVTVRVGGCVSGCPSVGRDSPARRVGR